MDFKDRLLLKVLKYIDIKLGTVQDNIIILNARDPYFTNEDRQFLFDTLIRLDNEFSAIQMPDSGHEDSYQITADQKEITSLLNWLSKNESELTKTRDTQTYTYKNLSLNLSSATLTYNGIEIPISPENKPIKYLLVLIQNQGKVVPHKEAARLLKLKYYDPSDSGNIDFSRDISMIKRDIKKELKALGKNNAEQVRDMVEMLKSTGSILR